MTASANWNEGGLKLTGGQLFEPGKGLISNPGLLVRNGRIEAVGEQAQAAESAATLDAAGQVIAPGFIDLCCNLREPGNGQKGNIASETRPPPMAVSPRSVPRRKPRRSMIPVP